MIHFECEMAYLLPTKIHQPIQTLFSRNSKFPWRRQKVALEIESAFSSILLNSASLKSTKCKVKPKVDSSLDYTRLDEARGRPPIRQPAIEMLDESLTLNYQQSLD
eukprot:TCONS_00038506-protein